MRKTRFALTLAPALLGALALAQGAQARVTVSVGRATAAHSVARLGARTDLPVNKGARRRPRAAGAAARAAVAAPRVASSAVAAAAPTIHPNFNGTSSRDSAVTNFQQEFEPPDQGLCVGNGFVMEPVNSAYNIYNQGGTKLAGPFNVNDPFNEGAREFTSDPRCYFDRTTNRWFATILFISTDLDGNFTDRSTLDIAVSRTADPRGLWADYHIDTTDADAPPAFDCPCFGDQPRLGIDSQNLYVTTDDYSILGPELNGDSIYAISKQDLVNGVAGPHFAHLSGMQDADGNPLFGLQPAITTGSSNAEFLLNAMDEQSSGFGDNRIEAWTLTNRGNVSLGGAPTLSGPRTIRSQSYAIPPQAEQKGTDSLLDTGDDRMQQVQFINGNIWGELGTAVAITGETQVRAGAAWFQLQPGTGGGLGGTRIVHQGYLASKGNHIMYPALQQMPNGNAVMGFSYSGPSRFPSTAFSVMPSGTSAFGPITVTANGTTNYDPNATRWGDYSWAILDPAGNGVWLADEYVPPASSQTPDRARNWGTRVWKVTP